jgi:hypothetical protein
MNNSERFESLVKEFLNNDNTYELQITNFCKFLSGKGLEEKVFNLYENHIDDFFIYALEENIGSSSQVISHISALKSLFGFLISKNLKFSELNGYIGTSVFKENLLKQVEATFNKPVLPKELLTKILFSIDNYIDENKEGNFRTQTKENTYYEMLIARLYIKFSLILPLKTSQMLDICLGNVKDNAFRSVVYNSVKIKIPNRKEIIFTINNAEAKYKYAYSKNDKIFNFLYSCINKKIETAVINNTLPRIYKELNLTEMLEKKSGGKKDKYLYPAECYKIAAISYMIENGVNIVYLTKLTGLDISTLISGFNFEDRIPLKDIVSTNINNAILSCDYFDYL